MIKYLLLLTCIFTAAANADFKLVKHGRSDYVIVCNSAPMAAYADLRGANLRGACLRGTILTGAELAGADFTGADVTGATVTPAARSTAIGWGSAVKPSVCLRN